MEGHWKSGELHYGEYQGSDGVILTGKWNQSSLSEGKMKTEFNEEFTGSFNPDGSFAKGTFLSSDGDRYTGHFQANSYHGSGVLEQKDGSLYVGSFAKGFFAGVGVWVKPSGSTYSGTFKMDCPMGLALSKTDRSDLFGDVVGRSEKGERQLDFGDGTSFSGEFDKGLAIRGSYDWGDGRVTDSYQDENGDWRDR